MAIRKDLTGQLRTVPDDLCEGTLQQSYREVSVDELPVEEEDKLRIKEWLLVGAELQATTIHEREEYRLILGELVFQLWDGKWQIRTTRKVGFSVVESFVDDYLRQEQESDRST